MVLIFKNNIPTETYQYYFNTNYKYRNVLLQQKNV